MRAIKRIPLIVLMYCAVAMPLAASPPGRGRVANRVVSTAADSPILIPLSYDKNSDPSLWTALYVHNRSSAAVSMSGVDCLADPCPETFVFFPLQTASFPLAKTRYHYPGVLVYSSKPEDLSFSLRLFDASRPDAAGTDIPVIRESELLSGMADLLGVSFPGSLEVTLRIYGSRPAERFAVRFFDDSGTLRKVLDSVTSGDFINGRRTFATSVQIDDLASLTELRGLSNVRIEVEPADTQTRFWTFVTVWNKQTGQITTVTPQ